MELLSPSSPAEMAACNGAALTIDQLGAELGVAAMSLYNHVANKESLLDAIAEALLGEIAVPPAAADWETIVREGFRSVRRVAHRHPALFPLLLDRVPHVMGEARLIEGFFEGFLEILCAAGFDGRTALGAFRVLSDFTIGYALAEARGFALEPGRSSLDAAALPAERSPRSPGWRPNSERATAISTSSLAWGLSSPACAPNWASVGSAPPPNGLAYRPRSPVPSPPHRNRRR